MTLDPRRPIELGAIVEPLHTVLNGQDQVRIRAGEAVLVLGLGPIGILHMASAWSAGAGPVRGVDPEAIRVAVAGTIVDGASTAVMDDDWVAAAREVVGGGGFDVVIVAVGSGQAVSTAIEMTEPGGRILAFAGLPSNASSFELDMNVLHYRQLSIVGAFGGTPDHFRRAAAWLAKSDFDVAAFTPNRFPLVDAQAAFASAARGEGLKTLLQLD